MITLPRPYNVRRVGRGFLGLPLYGVEKDKDEIVFASYDKNACEKWMIIANAAFVEGWMRGKNLTLCPFEQE